MAPPHLDLPPSQSHHVKVSIINGAESHMPSHFFFDATIKGHDEIRMATYSFLIENENKNQKVLFDLAFMKNLQERMPPALAALFSGKDVGGIDAVYNIPDTLTQNNLPLSCINAIILSHSHIDHVGDPFIFPPSTDLIVGPTFRSQHTPGYPVNPEAFLLNSAFEGRNVREIDFSESITTIGGFRAIDFFEDGSFYLLEGTGHTANHMCALARTSDDSFIFMAGDAAHHVGQLRPSEYLPLPETMSQNQLEGLSDNFGPDASCSCARYKALLPSDDASSSFYGLTTGGMYDEHTQAEKTVAKLKVFDARDDVLVIVAHDASLLGVLDFYPKTLNEWRQNGWGELGRWKFLSDFKDAVAKD